MNRSGELYPSQQTIKEALQVSDSIEKDRIFITNEVWIRLTYDDKIWLYDIMDSIFVFRDII